MPTTTHQPACPYTRPYRAQASIDAIARAYLRDAYRQGFADGAAQRASREDHPHLDYSQRQRLAYAIGHIVGAAQDRYDNPWRE